MSFFSTRGGSCVTASQAILRGLAGDGGLYVPSMFPVVSLEKTSSLSQMSYPRRAAEILSHFDRWLPKFRAVVSDEYLNRIKGA